MILLKILGSIVIIVVALFAIIASMAIIRHLWVLHSKKCSYCGHRMSYKGVGDHNEKSCYMFHCPVCKAWDYVPVINKIRKKSSDDKGI